MRALTDEETEWPVRTITQRITQRITSPLARCLN
jgi:hypothetical protein